ncbi:hypothetical protein K461DRAFT_290557 [Myriangium duriaei CBS 260.36]|uniref:Uncharacterized protein n=1 Tax=Myriangium duriaei CBS 260.36 TaxID=1168546 RepID=A0A9P4MI37_9PEZI|nr:hypothetical protein K461DRAFT_290557 [Myriangium duriaei CBS 260.36]
MSLALGRGRPYITPFTLRAAFRPPARPPQVCLTHQPCVRRGLLTTALADPGILSALPANLMAGLYETGIPWLVVFPLSALAIRSIFIYPRYQRQRRINQTRAAMLQPLVDAEISNAMLRERWSKQSRFTGIGGLVQQVQRRRAISKFRSTIVKQLEEDFNTPTWPWISRIIPLLILLAVSEGVRRLCGSKDGLLSILGGPFQRIIAWIATPVTSLASGLWSFTFARTASTQPDSPTLDATLNIADHDHAQTPAHENSQTLVQKLFGTFFERADFYESSTWTQTSLRSAGFSWCQDLTAPDPYKILPAIFSATFFASIWFNPGTPKEGNFYSDESPKQAAPKPKRTLLQKVFLGIAALSIFPAMNMPCALLWYFISNIAVSRLQMGRLMSKFPVLHPPVACKRPPMMASRSDRLDFEPLKRRQPQLSQKKA